MPVRLRVAAAVAVAMALVLAGAGVLIYTRVGDDLSSALDQGLRLRGQDVSALLSDATASLANQHSGHLIEQGESFAELLDPSGAVLDATRPIGSVPVIGGPQVQRALTRGSQWVNTRSVPGLDEPARLLTIPIRRAGRRAADGRLRRSHARSSRS